MRAPAMIAWVLFTVVPAFCLPDAGLAAEAATPIWRVPLETLTETRERPVFSRTRRPPPKPVAPPVIAQAPAPPPPSPPPPEPISLSLMGIVQGPNELNLAVVREDQTQVVKRLQIGETLNDWTLTEVRRREVTFKRATEIVTLEMPKPGSTQSHPGGAGGFPAAMSPGLLPGIAPQLPPGMFPTQRGGFPGQPARPPVKAQVAPQVAPPQIPAASTVPFPKSPEGLPGFPGVTIPTPSDTPQGVPAGLPGMFPGIR